MQAALYCANSRCFRVERSRILSQMISQWIDRLRHAVSDNTLSRTTSVTLRAVALNSTIFRGTGRNHMFYHIRAAALNGQDPLRSVCALQCGCCSRSGDESAFVERDSEFWCIDEKAAIAGGHHTQCYCFCIFGGTLFGLFQRPRLAHVEQISFHHRRMLPINTVQHAAAFIIEHPLPHLALLNIADLSGIQWCIVPTRGLWYQIACDVLFYVFSCAGVSVCG